MSRAMLAALESLCTLATRIHRRRLRWSSDDDRSFAGGSGSNLRYCSGSRHVDVYKIHPALGFEQVTRQCREEIGPWEEAGAIVRLTVGNRTGVLRGSGVSKTLLNLDARLRSRASHGPLNGRSYRHHVPTAPSRDYPTCQWGYHARDRTGFII
jgi:hypothetical protein